MATGTMQILGSHICCGANEIHAFYHTPDTPQYPNPADNNKQTMGEFFDAFVGQYKYSHLFTGILTDTEMTNWWKFLEERGFKLLVRFKNAYGNWCNLVGYVSYPVDEESLIKTAYKVRGEFRSKEYEDAADNAWNKWAKNRPWLGKEMTRLIPEPKGE